MKTQMNLGKLIAAVAFACLVLGTSTANAATIIATTSFQCECSDALLFLAIKVVPSARQKFMSSSL